MFFFTFFSSFNLQFHISFTEYLTFILPYAIIIWIKDVLYKLFYIQTSYFLFKGFKKVFLYITFPLFDTRSILVLTAWPFLYRWQYTGGVRGIFKADTLSPCKRYPNRSVMNICMCLIHSIYVKREFFERAR